MLSIVRLAHQKYAEIETDFVSRHRGEINGYWKVKKNDTDYHKLKFNNDYENPLILVQGWNKLKDFYNLPNNVQVNLIFHGSNEFEVQSVKEVLSPNEIPPFHSRSLLPQRTAVFDFELTRINIQVPKFRLGQDLGSFLQTSHFDYLVLCGDNGQKFNIHLLNINNVDRMKLGYNWEHICNCLNFNDGNVIRFKFELKSGNAISSRCHLMKLA
ncbi:hypothetical protein TSUD_85680 [Trifolium subterraneum]|uniref:TF-B3 domain-containing protein n=1 Tax=Trifolium subterraneum TaxID=3900 RepID=A0A2Z6P8I9_TRISU|nr:hypothetical protein TSUD_85680 [Trifolium subterraneum]